MTEFEKRKHFPQIEGLRGLAILLILAHHCFGTFFNLFWIGVDLFFVLSGFLITGILINTVSKKGYFLNFYARRTLRIFPLYYVVLIVVLLILPAINKSYFEISYLKENQVWFWFYIENWLIARDGWPAGLNVIISHFWSLAIEEQYYLVWPFLIYLFRNRINLIVYVIILLVIVAISLRFSGLSNPMYYIGTYTRMDSLLIGSLISVFAIRGYFNTLVKLAGLVFVISGLFIVVVLVITRDAMYSNPAFSTAGYTIIALFFASLIVLSFSEKGIVYKIFNLNFFKFFGKYSYGLYVFHFPVFWIIRLPVFNYLNVYLNDITAKILTSTLTIIITLVLSLISFYALEQPFLRLKKFFEPAKAAA